MNVHTTSLCLLLSAALWAAPAHAQQQPVPEAPTAGRSTLGQWSVVSGRVLGVGHWQDVVLKHQAGSYWIHASFARLNQDSFELGPSVRVFLPQGYSLDAQRVSVNLSKVHAYEPVTLSTPLGRVDAGATTLELSPSSLRVNMRQLARKRPAHPSPPSLH